jgi:phage-related protein
MLQAIWMGTSRQDLGHLSQEVKDEIGFGLYHAQMQERHPSIKPLKGLGGGILEIMADDRGGTYRAVYAAKFKGYIYVLHVFQKKSKKGGETPKPDMDLIMRRLAAAQNDFAQRIKSNEEE